MEERFHPPPDFSLPREAPWREIEEIIDGLKNVVIKLDLVVSTISGLPPGTPPPVIIPPGTPPDILLDGRLDTLLGIIEWGKATGGGDDSLIHMGKSWADDVWAGCRVSIIGGSGVGQTRRIKTNARTTLTTQNNWDVKPDQTSVYVIRTDMTVLANKPAWTHGQLDVTTAGEAEQLVENLEIPDGCQLTVLAKPGNTGTIYLGYTEEDCEDSTKRFDGLSAGLATSLQIDNANKVWVDASVSGEGVSYHVEQVS